MGKNRIAYSVVMGKPERNRSLGGSRRRLQDNIKMSLKTNGTERRGLIWLVIVAIGGLL
jgi:hypothetical protein